MFSTPAMAESLQSTMEDSGLSPLIDPDELVITGSPSLFPSGQAGQASDAPDGNLDSPKGSHRDVGPGAQPASYSSSGCRGGEAAQGIAGVPLPESRPAPCGPLANIPHGLAARLTSLERMACIATPPASLVTSIMLPAPAPLHVLPPRAIDVRLVAPARLGTSLEPRHHVGVQPQRYLLFHRAVEHPSPGVSPVEYFRRLRCIYPVVR